MGLKDLKSNLDLLGGFGNQGGTLGEMDSFNLFLVLSYNFNRLGYLSKFVPLISGLVRIHKESNSIKYSNSNAINADYYVKMVKNYREQLFSGKIQGKVDYVRNGDALATTPFLSEKPG